MGGMFYPTTKFRWVVKDKEVSVGGDKYYAPFRVLQQFWTAGDETSQSDGEWRDIGQEKESLLTDG